MSNDVSETWKKYKPHPFSERFPLMADDELHQLRNDIREHGLNEKIIIYNGMILDGRNRDLACRLAGVKPQYREIDFGSEAEAKAYVISANVHRRHLTPEQRRDLIVEVIAGDPSKSDRQIAITVGVDHKTVGKARKEGEDVGRIPHVKKRTDTKGRKQPVRRVIIKTETIDHGVVEPVYIREQVGPAVTLIRCHRSSASRWRTRSSIC